jgi:oxygen-independent coproporphyrinogen-3 oxidase
VEQSIETVHAASRVFGRENVSYDLLFGRVGQTLERWKAELHQALGTLDADHISLYQLTLERGTPLFQQMQQCMEMPEADTVAAMYECNIHAMASRGYEHYETSSFARSESAKSVHNQRYW